MHKRHETEREPPPTPLYFFFPYRRSQKGFYPLVYCMHMCTHISSRSAEVISLCDDMKRPQTDEPTHCPRGNRPLWKNRTAFLILCSIREVFRQGGKNKKSSRIIVKVEVVCQFHLRRRLGVSESSDRALPPVFREPGISFIRFISFDESAILLTVFRKYRHLGELLCQWHSL